MHPVLIFLCFFLGLLAPVRLAVLIGKVSTHRPSWSSEKRAIARWRIGEFRCCSSRRLLRLWNPSCDAFTMTIWRDRATTCSTSPSRNGKTFHPVLQYLLTPGSLVEPGLFPVQGPRAIH